MSKNMLQYPAPVYPDRPGEAVNVEQLMPYAREAVNRSSGRGALGRIHRGEKVLIVLPPGQDKLALDAIVRAFKEKGIETTTCTNEEVAGVSSCKLSKQIQSEGWTEIYWRKQIVELLKLEPRTIIGSGLSTGKALLNFFDCNPEFAAYKQVIVGPGGRRFHRLGMGKYADKFVDSWIYESAESLQSKLDAFPDKVLSLVERKVLEPLSRVSHVRITDPQGTDVSFSVSEDEAAVWAAANPLPGHLYMYPLHSFMAVNSDPILSSVKSKLIGQGINIAQRRTSAEGVIAGTANHTGYFPHMKTYLKDGQVYRIEGGGKFGDLLRELLEKTKNAHYPGYPHPGYLYLFEVALGTNPKFYRRRDQNRHGGYRLFVNSFERQRSGVFHWGIGIDDFDPDVVAYAHEKKLPVNHVGHAAHTYFNTYEITLRDSGEKLKIIDKGRLTALDDPEVIALAAQYGDPDEILREEWIPAIPGINYPGDYMCNYGNDPATWVRKEVEEQLPDTIGVPD